MSHVCERCFHDNPKHMNRHWSGHHFAVLCNRCLAKARVPKVPLCCGKHKNGTPCRKPGERVGALGNHYCHLHDPMGKAQANNALRRAKNNRRVQKALANMRAVTGASHAVPETQRRTARPPLGPQLGLGQGHDAPARSRGTGKVPQPQEGRSTGVGPTPAGKGKAVSPCPFD